MFSSITSYFTSNYISESYVANPALKDEAGLTPIDYTIMDGQDKQLPLLFQQPAYPTAQTKALKSPHLSNLKSILPHLTEIKEYIEQIQPKNLEDSSSKDYRNLKAFFQVDWAETNKTVSKQAMTPLHLLTLFAPPKVFQKALDDKLYSGSLSDTDRYGNSALHYAVLLPDQHNFVSLAKSGANLLLKNSDAVSPLAHLMHTVETKNPLRWSSDDVWIMLGYMFPDSGIFQLMSGVSNFRKLYRNRESTLGAAAFTGAYIMTQWVPVLRWPMRAYATYTVAKEAFRVLAMGGRYHLKRRPFYTVAIGAMKSFNAIKSIDSFVKGIYDDIEWVENGLGIDLENAPNQTLWQRYDNIVAKVRNKFDNFYHMLSTEFTPIILHEWNLSNLCSQEDGKPVYLKVYRELARERHPDRCSKVPGFTPEKCTQIFQKLGNQKETLDKTYKLMCGSD